MTDDTLPWWEMDKPVLTIERSEHDRGYVRTFDSPPLVPQIEPAQHPPKSWFPGPDPTVEGGWHRGRIVRSSPAQCEKDRSLAPWVCISYRWSYDYERATTTTNGGQIWVGAIYVCADTKPQLRERVMVDAAAVERDVVKVLREQWSAMMKRTEADRQERQQRQREKWAQRRAEQDRSLAERMAVERLERQAARDEWLRIAPEREAAAERIRQADLTTASETERDARDRTRWAWFNGKRPEAA